jgi:peptidase M23-like protein
MRTEFVAGVAGITLVACVADEGEVRTVDWVSARDGANGVVRWTSGKGVNVRAEPRADSERVDGLVEGERIAIACQLEGQSVQGNAIWDYVAAKDGYVADAFVDSGWPSWIAGVPRCGDDDEGCGELDYAGECDGTTLRWCEDDAVRTMDCAARSRECDWRDDDIGFDCIGGGDGGGARLTIPQIIGGVGYGVSQYYGPTNFDGGYSYCQAYTGYGGLFHCGIDVAIPSGTPLSVGEDATVVVVGSDYFEDWNRPWAADAGELRMETADGTHVIYGHMSRIDLTEGEAVASGDAAGLSGYANGDHVHIEVRVRDDGFASGYRTVDPAEYFGL